jgi:hypothetical protein
MSSTSTYMTSIVASVGHELEPGNPAPLRRPSQPQPQPSQAPETSDGCLCGCGKIVGGVIAVPVVIPISFLIGVGMTAVACTQCRCNDDDFYKQRNTFCACWGIGTGCLVGATLIAMGVQDIRYSGNSGKEVVSQQTMTR